ncbi:hypothetical protein TNCV_1916541 [Trichonephila clavipes]|uniref:Uncharacterized protein n=1 Tax=Trichonephila clavipes TaxID=2585209 RepID=A0A8X6W0Q1_TRICX|nr:hypothetical protein TNCV_1916541 [Trichonephila clavipes]
MISYPDNIPSAIRLVPDGPNIPMPLPPTEMQKNFKIYPLVKLTERIFVGPDIYNVVNVNEFETYITEKENNALDFFIDVIRKFLDNCKDPDSNRIAMNELEKFQNLDCSMNVNVHVLHSHVDSPSRRFRISQ